MVIRSSAVSMQTQASYSKATKVQSNVTYQPCLVFSGKALVQKEDGTTSVGSGNTNSTGLVVKDSKGNDFLSSLNYCRDKNGKVAETDSGQAAESIGNYRARLETMNYLLRILFYSRLRGENMSFTDIFNQAFQSSNTMLMTVENSYSYEESQEVSFSSTGVVNTADGRELEFNFSMTMSSSFRSYYEENYQAIREIDFIDPLVINLDDNPASISDQTFYFDLDADGTAEEISMLGPGSGYLALDLNGDGQINDGSELFGTKSGDGFKDLSIYDEDHNGWIDENDPIFDKLRIWTMDSNGKPELYTLRQSDVGAIYLGRARTDFIDYNSEHNAKGAIRNTGIYLKESTGRAASIQHVDMAT